MDNNEIMEHNNGKKFDIVLMNPPYARDLHIDFLQKAVDICNKVVIIEPGQWLVQLKENGKYTKEDSKTKKLKNQIKGHVKSVELNNYNKELNITNKTVCSITYIDMTNEFDEIEFENITEKKTVKTLEDCNLIGDKQIIDSIFKKCKNYKEHMIDHCINIKKYNDYENKGYWFLPYGNYMINNLGTMQTHRWTNAFHMKTNLIDTLNSYFVVLASPKIEELTYNVVPKGIKSGGPKDSVYGKKKELENWQYFAYHNKLPLFIAICLTIDENNNNREYVPWLTDKQYTDEEIYKLLNINKEEQHLIDETIKKFDKDSEFGKRLFSVN